MMLPNSGRQKRHNTEDGFPSVRSLFMVCMLPIVREFVYSHTEMIIHLTLFSVKDIFSISAIRI